MERTYLAGGHLLAAAIAVQIYAAGWGLFGAGTLTFHRQFGYAVLLIGLVLVGVVAAHRPPRRETLAWISVVVLIFLQPVLALVARRLSEPLAALHAVNATLAMVLAVLALGSARQRRAAAYPSVSTASKSLSNPSTT